MKYTETPWNKDRAFFYLQRFIQDINGEEFLGEDVRNFAHEQGLQLPPDNRAWGGVMIRAARAGLIKKNGYRVCKNRKAHNSPMTIWQKKSKP